MDGCNGLRRLVRRRRPRLHLRAATSRSARPTPIPGCKHDPARPLEARRSWTTRRQQRDRLQWSWTGGAATTSPSSAIRITTTRYALCIWDGRTRHRRRSSASTDVEAGTGWSTNGTTRVSYNDSHASEDGVAKIQVRTGVDGKAQAALQAKGAGVVIPTAASRATRFEADPDADGAARQLDRHLLARALHHPATSATTQCRRPKRAIEVPDLHSTEKIWFNAGSDRRHRKWGGPRIHFGDRRPSEHWARERQRTGEFVLTRT